MRDGRSHGVQQDGNQWTDADIFFPAGKLVNLIVDSSATPQAPVGPGLVGAAVSRHPQAVGRRRIVPMVRAAAI